MPVHVRASWEPAPRTATVETLQLQHIGRLPQACSSCTSYTHAPVHVRATRSQSNSRNTATETPLPAGYRVHSAAVTHPPPKCYTHYRPPYQLQVRRQPRHADTTDTGIQASMGLDWRLSESKGDQQERPRYLLSDFQTEKFTYYFKNFYDSDKDGVISEKDFEPFTNKVLEFTGWQKEAMCTSLLLEIYREFYDCLEDSAGRNGKVTLEDWLDLWGTLTQGAMGMRDFPCWVQLMPKMLFEIIDKDRDGLISEQELHDFYSDFVGIQATVVGEQTKKAFNAMTADKEYTLDCSLFEMIFANFLLGRNIYGPGKYVFGCFDLDEEKPFRLTLAPEAERKTSPKPRSRSALTAGPNIKRPYPKMN